MSVSATQSAELTAQGTGALADLAKPTFTGTLSADDLVSEKFAVNKLTNTPQAISMGLLTTGKVLWVQTNFPVTITVEQNATDRIIDIDTFFYSNMTFTNPRIQNNSITDDAIVTFVVVGNRVANPGTPGVF